MPCSNRSITFVIARRKIMMNSKRSLLKCLCLVTLTTILTSCAWPRRNDVEITPFNQQIKAAAVKSLQIELEESVPGKPLNETVWDNVSGPFWDIKESKLIGFTQNYKPQFFAIPPLLLPIAAQSGMNLIDSRIVIPFGNILSSMVESAAQRNFAASKICFDENCIANPSDVGVLKIKIDNFLVWEHPLNHLNLYIKGKSTYIQNDSKMKEYVFEKSRLTKKLGSVFSTHSMIITEMNKMANQFAEEVTAEIITKGL